MTTSLTIYGFGLRGNSAYKSIGKHRFRTKKHHKVNKSSQKTMAYLFGTLRSWVRSPSPRPKTRENRLIFTGFLLVVDGCENARIIVGSREEREGEKAGKCTKADERRRPAEVLRSGNGRSPSPRPKNRQVSYRNLSIFIQVERRGM